MNDQEPKKTENNLFNGLIFGMLIGIIIDNIPLGVLLGMGVTAIVHYRKQK